MCALAVLAATGAVGANNAVASTGTAANDAVAATGAVAPSARAHATTLRTRLNSDILGTDPAGRRDENTDSVLLHMFEGLVAYREDTSIGPMLAASWQTLEGGRTYLFQLRHGVRFHNDATLTAADVVWSFKRYLDPATRWRCLADLDGRNGARIVSVTAPEPYTVRIELDRPFPLFLKTIARSDCGSTAVMHRDSVAADGRWRSPIGTGPYRFLRRSPNQYIELTRFPEYSSLPGPRDGNTGGKHAYADIVRFTIIPDPASAQAAFNSGALDILESVQASALSEFRERGDIKLEMHPTMDAHTLLFQTQRSPLDDVRVRRAIAHTIDVPALTNACTHGGANANPSAVPISSPFHTRAHDRMHSVDLALARKLLAQSRYRGEPITLITNRRYPEDFDAAILVQAMARKAGIDFRIEVVDWATQLDRYQRGAYQAMTFPYSARLDPSFSYSALIGSKAIEPRKVWDDPVAQELLAQSMATGEAPLRQRAFDELHTRLLDQVPMLVLHNSSHVSALARNVSGFKNWAAVQQRLWGVLIEN